MTEDKPDFVKALKEAAKEMGAKVLDEKETQEFIEKEWNSPENVKARRENERDNEKMLAEFFAKDHKYKWLPGMGQISGFGGSYEDGCRAMVIAGLEYWDAHPELDPQYKGFEGVYGILSDNNEDAKRLDDVVLDAVKNEATGAMHHAAIGHIIWIKKNSWQKFVEEMKKRGK